VAGAKSTRTERASAKGERVRLASVVAPFRADATEDTKPSGRAGKTKGRARAAQHQVIPSGAKKARLPEKLFPQLATLVSAAPTTGDWIYEVKFDGYRILTRIKHGKPALFTRRGHDWSSKMPALVEQLRTLGIKSAWLDGEIVVMGKDGVPSFNALQNAFDRARTADIQYFLFDVPFFEGYDLRQVPLRDRRRLLKTLLETRATDKVRFSDDLAGDGTSIFAAACRMKLEGVIAKRADAPYVSRRSETWLKLKCTQRQEFVIVGFTDRKGERTAPGIGSLLLGVHDDAGKLVFAGSVGTGWSTETAADLKRRLVALEVKHPPFADATKPKSGRWSRRSAVPERWVKPVLVAEISFSEWTPDGQLRHASFEGLRMDKPAQSITRERALEPELAGRKPLRR
jgi:bifunctional non-homologous end joining protein LigD